MAARKISKKPAEKPAATEDPKTPPASDPASPAPADPAPPVEPDSPAPEEPAPAPKKRGGARKGAGRPKGSKNKVKKAPDTGPDLMGSRPRGETRRSAAPSAADAPEITSEKAGEASIPVAAMIDPEGLADILVSGLDNIAVTVGSMRYGEAAQALAISGDDRGKLVKSAAVEVIKDSDMKVTPFQALLFAVAMAYGPAIGALEANRQQAAK